MRLKGRNSLRIGCAALVGLSLTATLAACDNNNYFGKTAIQQSGSTIRIAVCERVVARTIEIAKLDASESLEDRGGDFFTASGHAKLETGFVLDPEKLIHGIHTAQSKSPGSTKGKTIVIHINRGSSDEVRSFFVIPRSGLSTDMWLRSDDTVTKSPCTNPWFR